MEIQSIELLEEMEEIINTGRKALLSNRISVDGDELLAFFLRQPEVRYAYKINSTNVHFDIPKGAR